MKRSFAFLLLFALLTLCLCACDRQPTAALCFRQADDGAYAAYYDTLQNTLADAGYQVTVADAMNDQSRQSEQIGDFIKKKTDVLIVEPVMTSAAAELVAQVKEGNTPTVFVNREPGEDALALWDRVSYVGCDTANAGALQAQIVLQLPDCGDLNGDGSVSYAILRGPEDHLDAQARTDSCTGWLAEANILTPLLTTVCGDWTQDSGRRLCEQMLAQYGKDLEVIFCNSDEMALGAMASVQAGGRTVGKDIYLLGIDALPEAVNMVKLGLLTGTVSTDIQGQAEQILAVCQALLKKQPVQKQYYIACAPVVRSEA